MGAENAEEKSLSEEVASSRLARAADADPGRSKKKNKSKRMNKNASKRKNKSKSKNKKKASKKRNKSKRKNNSRKKNRNSKNNRNSSKKEKKSRNKKRRQNKNATKKDKKSRNNKKNREGKSDVRDVPDSCLTTSVNILYNGQKKASNFDRQSKRIETRVPIIAKKLAKASYYNVSLEYLNALNS